MRYGHLIILYPLASSNISSFSVLDTLSLALRHIMLFSLHHMLVCCQNIYCRLRLRGASPRGILHTLLRRTIPLRSDTSHPHQHLLHHTWNHDQMQSSRERLQRIMACIRLRLTCIPCHAIRGSTHTYRKRISQCQE